MKHTPTGMECFSFSNHMKSIQYIAVELNQTVLSGRKQPPFLLLHRLQKNQTPDYNKMLLFCRCLVVLHPSEL